MIQVVVSTPEAFASYFFFSGYSIDRDRDSSCWVPGQELYVGPPQNYLTLHKVTDQYVEIHYLRLSIIQTQPGDWRPLNVI